MKELTGFYFKKLSARTSILKLPSFEYQHLEEIGQLISSNKKGIEGCENLIIDLRGNPGGTTDAYQKLLPYISGKTIRNTGAEFLATQTYIGNLEAYKRSLKKGSPTSGIDNNIELLKRTWANSSTLTMLINLSTSNRLSRHPKAPGMLLSSLIREQAVRQSTFCSSQNRVKRSSCWVSPVMAPWITEMHI